MAMKAKKQWLISLSDYAHQLK